MNPFLQKGHGGKRRDALLRLTMFLILFIVSLFVATPFADAAPVPKKPSETTIILERGLGNLIDLVFLFDRIFTRSTTVTSTDYLKRVSEPSSKFYPDYLEYKNGQISRAELHRRLPHVVLLSMSGSKNFYISSVPSMFWRARTE